MHPMWSRNFTRLIQISHPPKFIKRGHCLYVLLSFSTLTSYLLFRHFVGATTLCFILQVWISIYKSDSSHSTLLAISLIAPSTSDSQADTSLISPCFHSIAAAKTVNAS